MTILQNKKSRYQLLREQEQSYVERRWASGKTVLKWTLKDPEPEFKEEELHELGYEGTDAGWYHTPYQICRPDLPFGGKRCDKHQAELDELIATSPEVAVMPEDEEDAIYAIHDKLVDVKEDTIRQQFARKGILVLTPRASQTDDGDDDPMTNVEDGDAKEALYSTVNAEMIGLIELEKKMFRAGPVRSISIKDDKLRMRGFEDLSIEDQKAQAIRYLRYAKKHPVNPKRAKAQYEMTKQLNEAGEKATIFRLYGITDVPKEYFEVDEDPNRNALAETDMDLHDVHTIVEPIDPDLDPTVHTLQPDEYEVKFFMRGHTVPYLGETDAFERNKTFRTFLANKTLHVGSYISPSLTGDHDMAESEWDLGVEFLEQVDIDADWVKELLAKPEQI